MRLLSKTKDGGPDSPVDAYFLFEIKNVCSLALLRFNVGGREAFHTHAFTALTWFICGDMYEETYEGVVTKYSRSLLPKITKKGKNHRVRANKTSWCITIRGPWSCYWTEDVKGVTTTFTHGRTVVDVKSVDT